MNRLTIVDNFYNNIDYVLSLSTEACRNAGCGPGLRSELLENIDRNLYNDFCDAIYSMNGIDHNRVRMTTYFTEHVYNPEKNEGLIHIDGRNPNNLNMTIQDYKLILCGHIFLTPTKDLDTGIKFYKVNESTGWSEEEEFNMTLNKCYTFDKQQLQEYNKNFYEIAEAKNIQNRMVSWNAGTKYRLKMTEKQKNRIIQNFYISLV